MILILGRPEDDHARLVRETLRTRGVRAEFLSSLDFPGRVAVSFDPQNGAGRLTLPSDDGIVSIGFDEVDAVYWRSYDSVGESDLLADPMQRHIARHDSRSLFETLFSALPCRWVNGLEGFRLHQTKPVALARAARLGLAIPRTCIANDAEAVRAFCEEVPHAIFKPVQGGAGTAPIEARHLTAEALARLSLSPVTLQEEIPGTDVRVFVAGGRVYACEMLTDALDFREDPYANIVPIELPADIREQALTVAKALHLVWTGIDFRRTPEGKWVFFEANPSPMFRGFELRTGLPLTEALIELLLGS
jgi:glutathione synthase/RimK-type ligase-like ATP-grasp enzyme